MSELRMDPATQAWLLRQWTRPNRAYHSLQNHLIPLLEQIAALKLCAYEEELLSLAAWWHDAVYEPGQSDNEEQSAAEFMIRWPGDFDSARRVRDIILASKRHLPTGDSLADAFLRLDLAPLLSSAQPEMRRYEELIRAEFMPLAGREAYLAGRIAFLRRMLEHPLVGPRPGLEWLISELVVEQTQPA